MATFEIGRSVTRTEDDRLLRGRGRFIDDINLDDQAIGYILRSPHAHADILSIDCTQAMQSAGVFGIVTAADIDADGLGDLPCLLPVESRAGHQTRIPPTRALAGDRVRYVGEPVALIVATSEFQARHAAERIVVDYRPRPPFVETTHAVAADSPLVWDDIAENSCFVWEDGDAGATERAFTSAAHQVSIELRNNRLVVHPMEPRGAIGAYDPDSERYTLIATTQGTQFIQSMLAKSVFGIPDDSIRVITPDVGGAFGTSLPLYPEQVLVLWAARQFGRPIKWINDRSQSFLSDTQGRDHATRAELALDREGHFLALRATTTANLGASPSTAGPAVPTLACKGMQSGVYRLGAVHVSVRGVLTNTVPIDAYRGAGNPETHYMLERLIDTAAAQTGIDRLDLRRRNMITASDIPFATVLGHTYDSGDFPNNMTRAVAAIDLNGLTARRAAARQRGRCVGIGFANHIKPASGAPFGPEGAILRVGRDGAITLLSGSQSTGQGHETAFAQMVAQGLGVPLACIKVKQGDTQGGAEGHGTSASRSMVVGGTAVHRAVKSLIECASQAAAEHLEVAAQDLEFDEGQFRIVGTDRAVSLFTLAAELGETTGLSGTGTHRPAGPTYPNGCHACEVEVDPETGAVRIIAFAAVDDYGTVINPLLLAGQVHGGVVQGIGQALLEHARFDAETGQPLTGSLMDYALPRADDVPYVKTEWNGTPCPSNPLGVKGGGESGCVGASPAVVNAIIDALSGFGVRHIDMPATPEQVWRAITAVS